MNNRMMVAGQWLATLVVVGLSPGHQDAGITEGKGEGEGAGAFQTVSHIVVCAPSDCPTCFEFLMAEASRLSNERAWRGKWAMVVAAESVMDTIFAQWLRDRYDPPLLLLTMERRALSARLPGGLTATPCLVLRDPDGILSAARVVTPGTLGATAEYFDSLYVSGPGQDRR